MDTRWLCLLFLTTALAGCSGDAPSDTGSDLDGAPDTGTDETEMPEEVPVEREEPVTEAWYFTAGGGFQNETPDAGEVNAAFSATAILLGMELVEFVSEPFEQTFLVHNEDATVTLYLTSDAPMVSNHAFDVAVWGGSTLGLPLFALTTNDAVVAPGEPYELTIPLPFNGQRGILVPAGESLRFLIGTNMIPGEESGLQYVITGGDTPSHVMLTRQYLGDLDPLAGATEAAHDTRQGQVTQGFTPTDCDSQPGTTSQEFAVPVSPDAVGIQGAIKATASHGQVTDLDLDLYAGGTLIASGHSPYDDEGFFLAGMPFEGLAGQDLTAKVSTCGQGPIDFDFDVTEWLLPTVEATMEATEE